MEALAPTVSVAVLRSAWVEPDVNVRNAMWQPLLMFLKGSYFLFAINPYVTTATQNSLNHGSWSLNLNFNWTKTAIPTPMTNIMDQTENPSRRMPLSNPNHQHRTENF